MLGIAMKILLMKPIFKLLNYLYYKVVLRRLFTVHCKRTPKGEWFDRPELLGFARGGDMQKWLVKKCQRDFCYAN